MHGMNESFCHPVEVWVIGAFLNKVTRLKVRGRDSFCHSSSLASSLSLAPTSLLFSISALNKYQISIHHARSR